MEQKGQVQSLAARVATSEIDKPQIYSVSINDGEGRGGRWRKAGEGLQIPYLSPLLQVQDTV